MQEILGLPILASEHGGELDGLTWYIHLLMAALFVGWLGYFIYVIIRFRSGRNPQADYHGVKSHFSSYLEVAVAVIEIVLLVGFAVPLWASYIDDAPKDGEDAIFIRVIGEQFSWGVVYPGPDGKFGKQDISNIGSGNKYGYDPDDPDTLDNFQSDMNIKVPINRVVRIDLSSLDVIHSFGIKPMRVAQDCIPGMVIPLWFEPNRIGRYQVQCEQLCGNAHYRMKGYFEVVTQEEYDQWVEQESADAISGESDMGGFE
ncbi:MAG TPA: cytochrome c oxidase subunit II [Verrucomicrobiales bacterium]|nr:cytochrome c oxidase subunit II [Verrucomicrobiales bacterium]HIL70754.1 cytochrome c oxidase subunit II [Verrucomicrobiota bacterium]